MTYEAYYGSRYSDLTEAQNDLEAMAEKMKAEAALADDLQPIVYYCSRIKKPESMKRKLLERGLPDTPEAALSCVYDAVGLRMICSFANDIQWVVKEIENNPTIEIMKKKDYLSRPKPNGYRSIHLCICLKKSGVLAEIQVRTIAMDFWATLEHQLKYKKDIRNEDLIRSELKRCADEIASVDLSMQTIKEIIKEI